MLVTITGGNVEERRREVGEKVLNGWKTCMERGLQKENTF